MELEMALMELEMLTLNGIVGAPQAIVSSLMGSWMRSSMGSWMRTP